MRKKKQRENIRVNELWGGRFSGSAHILMEEINSSIDFDQRLFSVDIYASKAHATMLGDQGIISGKEAREINERVSSALFQSTGEKYRGILYGGFMVTGSGVKLIEYNARFGDPEAMNLLTLLDDDFASICYSMADGQIDQIKFRKL